MPRRTPHEPIFRTPLIRGSVTVGNTPAIPDTVTLAVADARSASTAENVTLVDLLSNNLTAWWDASDATTFTLSGSDVVEWLDKGPFGRDWVTVTGTPQRVALGGLHAVTFDGVNDGFEETSDFMSDAAASGSGLTLYAVVAFDNAGGAANKTILGEYYTVSGTPLYLAVASGTAQVQRFFARPTSGTTEDVQGGADIMDGTYRLLIIRSSTAGTSIYQGTTLIASGAGHTAPSAVNRRTFGKSGAGNYTNCAVAEIIAYADLHDSTERAGVAAYLTAKWGL